MLAKVFVEYQIILLSLIVMTTISSTITDPTRFSLFSSLCLNSQSNIIQQLEAYDTKGVFNKEAWSKSESSYGVTAVLEKGDIWEKAAVSTTITKGILTTERASSLSAKGRNAKAGDNYSAAALSLVLHSRSPMVPTFRADVRYFELDSSLGWFGGGADLTPYYLFDSDAQYFHKSLKETCDKYSNTLYPKFKTWCDDYFYLPARGEHRGIGGIFFDDLEFIPIDKDKVMDFVQDICDTFMISYLPIVLERKCIPYTESQRHFQLLRRGRYVEFNLLYDRGVKFGLVPGGRTEAVLVSCPPVVAWDYNYIPESGSEEARLMDVLKQPKNWT